MSIRQNAKKLSKGSKFGSTSTRPPSVWVKLRHPSHIIREKTQANEYTKAYNTTNCDGIGI